MTCKAKGVFEGSACVGCEDCICSCVRRARGRVTYQVPRELWAGGEKLGTTEGVSEGKEGRKDMYITR